MKKKLILIALLGSILSIIIYLYTKSDELTLVSIGDGLASGTTPYNIEGISYNDYLKEYLENNHRLKKYYEYATNNKTVKELIFEIKENKKILYKDKKIELQHVINYANILTIAIGLDELSNSNLSISTRKEFLDNFEDLLNMIKLLNQEKIIILGVYTKDNKNKLNFATINATLRDLCLTNNFVFIDISDISNSKKYFLLDNNYYPNYLGHKAIYDKVIDYIK